MESNAQKEYAAFLEKVKRTIYIDNLSPQVTESILRTAIEQFGAVKNVQFIPNYVEMNSTSQSALVEVENSQQAQAIEQVISLHPFMICGMPRPVRARPAVADMFDDRPPKPGRKITIRWLDPNEPDFQVAQKIKRRVNEHAAEAGILLKQLTAEEEKLDKQQAETLEANHQKYTLIDSVIADRTAQRLARYYQVPMAGD